MSMHHFAVSVDENGQTVVRIDDKIVRPSAFRLECKTGWPSVLVLELPVGESDLEGSGIVQVAGSAVSTSDISDFLSDIDPDELNAAVLERASFADSTMAVALEILREWAGNGPTG